MTQMLDSNSVPVPDPKPAEPIDREEIENRILLGCDPIDFVIEALSEQGDLDAHIKMIFTNWVKHNSHPGRTAKVIGEDVMHLLDSWIDKLVQKEIDHV